MLDLRSVLKQPIPSVNPAFLKQLCFQGQHEGDSGIMLHAITEICGSSSDDPLAIWARIALIGIALKAGKLNNLVQNGSLPQAVFDAAATLPLPDGLEGFDCDAFAARVTREQPSSITGCL